MRPLLAKLGLASSGLLLAPPISVEPPPSWVPDDAYVDVDGARLRVIDSGGVGETVLFLHSAVGDADVWAHQLSALSAAGYRAIAFDRPGHGLTEGTWSDGEAVGVQRLADALRLEAFHLVGVAQGGRIANEVALARPGQVRSLTIVATLGGVAVPLLGNAQPAHLPAAFLAMDPWFRELGPAYRAVDPAGTRRWMKRVERTRPAPGRQRGPRPGAVDVAALRALDMPVLIVGGDADLYAPAPLLRQLVDCYRDASLVVVPECGHSPQWERPDQFNRVLSAFLDGVTG